MNSVSWKPVRFLSPVLVIASYLFGSSTSPSILYANDSHDIISNLHQSDRQELTSHALTSAVRTTGSAAGIDLEQVSVFPQISSSFKPSNPLIPISMKKNTTCRECHPSRNAAKEKRRYGMNL